MKIIKIVCFYCGVGCGLEVLLLVILGKVINCDSKGNLIW